MDYISTSALSNQLEIKSTELFEKLRALGWIHKINDKWMLTEIGKKKGGQTRLSPQYGEFIVWPADISINEASKQKLLNATAVGQHFGVSSQRLNLIISELGWIEKKLSGWAVTKLGKTNGGVQFEHETSGSSYVLWPDTVLSNKNLNAVFQPFTADNAKQDAVSITDEAKSSNDLDFRKKFDATHRTQDGHYVRSKSEMLIDNLLYQYGVVHAYERKLPIDEDVYCDFYLPAGKVYIEYWGLENDPKYLERKRKKLEIYRKHELALIELNEADISNLDDHLPKKLLKYNIKVY